MATRLWKLALVTYGLAAVAAMAAWSQQGGPPPPTPAPARPPAPSGPLVGFTINLHFTDQLPLYLRAVDELADLGFNSVQVVTPVYQSNGASESVRVEVGPGLSPRPEDLVALLKRAKRHGMATALMPIVLLTHPRSNEWRGKIHPDDWRPWWRSYQRMIDEFIDIADEAEVDAFCVGSELVTTEQQGGRWRDLIAQVRQRYTGRLYYSANWDRYDQPTFWDALDAVGVNGYFDVSGGESGAGADSQTVAANWAATRGRLLAFAGNWGRPLLFTELGYPSLPWALQRPWNYVPEAGVRADVHAQAVGYSAFLGAWGDLLTRSSDADALAGVFFYEWSPTLTGGAHDASYAVRGKPALVHLRAWLQSR